MMSFWWPRSFPPGNPGIGWIPSSVPEYKLSAKNLSYEEIEFLSPHCRIFYLPFSVTLCMLWLNVLMKQYTKPQNDLLPCISFTFRWSHCRPWLHKDSHNKSGRVLCNNLFQQNLALFNKMGSSLKEAYWAIPLFVDSVWKWIKFYHMQNATGNVTLEERKAFEHAIKQRGLRPKHYHADDGWFVENLFTEDYKSIMQNIFYRSTYSRQIHSGVHS